MEVCMGVCREVNLSSSGNLDEFWRLFFEGLGLLL